jgi:hypothetical protein
VHGHGGVTRDGHERVLVHVHARPGLRARFLKVEECKGPICEKKENSEVMSNFLGRDMWSPLPRQPKPSSKLVKGVNQTVSIVSV